MKTLLRGGYVVSGRGCRRADVLIDGEKVEMLGHIPPELAAQSEVVDVTGCMLFPGFIDAHTHFDLDVCNTTTADDFESGSKSAIRGGTTTVIDFACPNKGESLAYGLDLWHKKADGKCYCDYGFHMTIDDWNESIESELDAMFDAGITSFKMYLTYPAMMIGDGAVYRALKALKVRGGIAGVHCENAGVIDARIAELKASGLGADVVSHPISRPDYLEAEAVSRLLRIAQAADALAGRPVAICQTATTRPVALARRLVESGIRVTDLYCDSFLPADKTDFEILRKKAPGILVHPTTVPEMRFATPAEKRDDIVAIGQKAAFFTGATHMLNMIEGGPWWGHGGVRSLALALAAAAREPIDVDRIISVKGYGCNGCC